MKNIFVAMFFVSLMEAVSWKALAADIPALEDVPACLPADQKAVFEERHGNLRGDKGKLDAEAQAFNRLPAESQTDAAFDKIVASKNAYIEKANAFNKDLKNAPCPKQAEPEPVRDDKVDPRWFAMPGEADGLEVRLEALRLQKKVLQDERDRLKKLEGGLIQQVSENVMAERILLQNAQSDTLDAIDGMLVFMGVSGAPARLAGSALAICQAYASYNAYSSAEDQKRRDDKEIDTITAVKNLVFTNIGGKDAENVKSATDSLMKIYKILDRHRKSGEAVISKEDLKDAYGAMVDATQAVQPFTGAALKMAKLNHVSTLDFMVTVKGMDYDRKALERVIQDNMKALDYYDEQLGRIEYNESFYQERLNRLKK